MKEDQNGNTNSFNRKCFFCSDIISDKKTLEHIIPDSLLGVLGIKESPIHVKNNNSYIYSRIKVPAHNECNSGFGSQYESKVVKLINEPEKLYAYLTEEENEIPIRYSPNDSVTSVFSTWLAKVYYGLFYHDYLKTQDQEWKEISREIIDCKNFDLIKESYKMGYGFYLPSSLFAFRLSSNSEFDLRTFVSPQCIMMKVKRIVLILCIGDGYLVKNYLNNEPLENLRFLMKKLEEEQENYPAYLNALAEILALWRSIPKSPSFIVSDTEILNMSLSTMAANPTKAYAIDKTDLKEYRKIYLDHFFSRTRG